MPSFDDPRWNVDAPTVFPLTLRVEAIADQVNGIKEQVFQYPFDSQASQFWSVSKSRISIWVREVVVALWGSNWKFPSATSVTAMPSASLAPRDSLLFLLNSATQLQPL